jgi:hypothetical protein
MSNIVINYVIDKDIDDDQVKSMFNNIYLKNHNLEIYVYDFSIDKKLKQILDSLVINNLKLTEYPYEQHDEADDIIIDNMKNSSNFVAFTNLKNNIVINNETIDSIDFDILQDDQFGFLYLDYYIGNIRCYMQSNKPGSKINTPIIFWSTEKAIKTKGKNVYNTLYRSYMGIHAPKSGCTVVY